MFLKESFTKNPIAYGSRSEVLWEILSATRPPCPIFLSIYPFVEPEDLHRSITITEDDAPPKNHSMPKPSVPPALTTLV